MNTTSLHFWPGIALIPMLLAGCGPDEVEPHDVLPPDTKSAGPPGADGADGTAGDSESRQRVCSVYDGEDAIVQGSTSRWHCSGTARANVKIQLPGVAGIDDAIIDYIADSGLDFQENFGPSHGASLEDPAVIACCEVDYDYPNTPPPSAEDAEHGWACGVDCVDQTCRMIPDILRDFANEHETLLKVSPFLCGPATTPCYFSQIWALSNYVASHHQSCVETFLGAQSPFYEHQVVGLGGALDLDAWIAANDPGADDAWPSIQGVVIEGGCGINGPDFSGWELPPGPTQPCTDSNDNNDENPFESGRGGGFWGPDTFAPSSGQVFLDAPDYMGAEADGSAPMKGSGNTDCDDETCTWLSVQVRNDTLYLQDLHIVVPENLVFTAQSGTLLLDDFRMHVDHPERASIDPLTGQFIFKTGSVKVIASGELYGVPIFAQALNTSPLQGAVQPLQQGDFDVTLEPVSFGTTDALGHEWTLQTEFGPLQPIQKAPRAAFEMTREDDSLLLDASTTWDGDGDELLFTWYVDGTEVGHGIQLRVPWNPASIHVVSIRVEDDTGRNDWALRLVDGEP